ncbi:beta/alpha barrel domain-containing protein [Paraliomyxa miuraensis]|uniref:nicotinate phosphoribosyltransferase n=1 Tax=Paraliomyxa miuraensis TaxID=376150 RepID=UPI00225BC3D0|nr:nicotinate phosphoribosyltransferase [Paraliomyxa miuraensis]MCX4242305.1 nicotinate phosphoribosyltransferase [Paraliomyxa miuraensis]
MTTSSVLATDAYKFSMAQAGFPLRRETFYLSFRFGGFQYVPFDLATTVRAAVDRLRPTPEDLAFAREHGYGMSDAMEAALAQGDALQVQAVPAGSWVYEREPMLTVTGPSFLVSWLEPMLLWLNYPIQLATALKSGQARPPGLLHATCAEHASIIESVAEAVHAKVEITREDEAYHEGVRKRARSLVEAVQGDAARIFEVGMRSAVCMEQHRAALVACQAEGITLTSNVQLARELGMTPVGTMGHEHVQRWGADLPAFRAMRDMRVTAPSYLLDTFDTMGAGIKAAVQVMREREHACAIRYDSGNKFIQYLHASELLREHKLQPAHVLEDSLDDEATRHFERLREFTGWPAERQVYGFGGFLVAKPMGTPLTRDAVSAVYKLSETAGEPRMKFGNAAASGKRSVPGRPVVWRRRRGDGPIGIIGQAGESVPDNYVDLSCNPEAMEHLRICNVLDLQRAMTIPPQERWVDLSPATKALVQRLTPAGELVE